MQSGAESSVTTLQVLGVLCMYYCSMSAKRQAARLTVPRYRYVGCRRRWSANRKREIATS
jgi:hypothetical protein